MYIKTFIYVNWGNIPNTEFDMGPINLLSGGNGSGKTTAADAIQTVMTAAHDNLFHFNPGQDESTQRGRGGKQVRTLASYVLGCDDGAYARPYPCDGYLAAVFHPTEGEAGEPFTAVIAMRAFLEVTGAAASLKKIARLEDVQFYILPGESLSLSHFQKHDVGGQYVLPVDRVYTALRNEFSAETVEKYDKKKAYLCRLYGALRGKREAVAEREAMNAARAFSRFMAYKPVKSINDFVAGEILESKDLGEAIRDVSGMLKRIHGMEADARALNESITLLGDAKASAASYIDQWLSQQVAVYTSVRSRYLDDQKRYLTAKQSQQDIRSALLFNEQERTTAVARREELRQQVLEVEAQRLGVPALRDKDQFEQQINMAQSTMHRLAPQLLKQDACLQRNLEACSQIQTLCAKTSITLDVTALTDKPLMTLGRDILAAKGDTKINFQGLFTRDWVDISPLESHLDQALSWQQSHNKWASRWLDKTAEQPSLRDQLVRERNKRQEKSQQLLRQNERKEAEINALCESKQSYPHYVRSALEAIAQQCPEADARVLCDHVEITDSLWQSAIEGYIGGARFGIIVEPEYEAEATQLLRNLPGRDNRARVIQGEKVKRDADRVSLSSDSIAKVMQFSHATVEAYVRASYGSVQRVDSANELRNTRRGLTQSSMGSGNYAMFRCDISDAELVFGLGARQRAELAKREELVQLLEEWRSAQDQLKTIELLLSAVESIAALTYADDLQAMLDCQRKLRAAENSLKQLDLGEFDALDGSLEQLKDDQQLQDDKITSLDNDKGGLNQQLKQVDRLCGNLSEAQEETLDQVEEHESGLRKISTIWPGFDVDKQLDAADLNAADTPVLQLEAAHDVLIGELKQHLFTLQKTVLAHNQQAAIADSVPFEPDYNKEHSSAFFKDICSVEKQLDAILNRLKNNILAKKHTELEVLKQSFNNTFVTNLCHSIYQAINDGKRTLEQLNSELQSHRFGADRERFYFEAEWVPEFKEYWQFFKAVIDSATLGEGEGLFDMKLETKHARVRDRIMAMLLDEDEVKALRELERLSDYRNYRSYEIFKEPEGKAPIALSQYGTGSGGQLETPAYIIRSAAITSAFRFNEGKSHLRMVLVDEAFSKMDEHRSKEVINYLTGALGLQLLFIMPTSKSGPFMDLISNQFVFTKCPVQQLQGSMSELGTSVLVDRQTCNRDKIQQLWANHRRTIRHQASMTFMQEFDV